MVCYIVPLAMAVIFSAIWGFSKRGTQGFWLNLMLYGAAMFGVVDHVWHGELFLISNLVADLTLGGMITGAVFGAWGITLGISKMKPELANRMGILQTHEK